MQSRTVGLTASRLLLALSLTFAGAGVWAQATTAEDHTAHHPADAASNAKPAPKAQSASMNKGSAEKMGQMDAKMKAMQDMHEKFMAAKTPEERMALMPEQMKTMQEAMTMMEGMRSGGMGMMGDKGGMGMMGGADKGAMMDKMPMGMSPKHQMMEKRMDMMQSMMQMMMDRMQVPAAK